MPAVPWKVWDGLDDDLRRDGARVAQPSGKGGPDVEGGLLDGWPVADDQQHAQPTVVEHDLVLAHGRQGGESSAQDDRVDRDLAAAQGGKQQDVVRFGLQ